jgi:hypothetical protein
MPGLLNLQLRDAPAGDDRDEREPRPAIVADAAPADPEPVPEVTAEPAPGPLVPLEGGPMARQDQFLAALTHAFRLARRRSIELAEREGGMARGLLGGKAPSVLEQHEYAKSRNWIPPGNDGGVIEGMGVIYHWLVGRPGVAYGLSVAAISARPFRACATAAGAVIAAVIVLAATGHRLAAILTALGAALLAGLWAGAGWLLMRIVHLPARDNETEDE